MTLYYTDIPFYLPSEPRTSYLSSPAKSSFLNIEKEDVASLRVHTPPPKLPVISRILILKSAKTISGKKSLSVFDTNNYGTSCYKCNECIFMTTAEKISDFAFGSSYVSYLNSGCIKIQKLHSNCVILSLSSDLNHSSNFSTRKNNISQSVHSCDSSYLNLSASPIYKTRSQFSFNPEGCEHFIIQEDATPMSRSRTQSSLSMFNPFLRSPDTRISSSWDSKDTSLNRRTSTDFNYMVKPNSLYNISPIREKYTSRTVDQNAPNFKLSLVVILHEQDEHNREIDKILDCMELERAFEKFIDKFYDIISNNDQITQSAFFDTNAFSRMCEEFRNELSQVYQKRYFNENCMPDFNAHSYNYSSNTHLSNDSSNDMDVKSLNKNHLTLLISLHNQLNSHPNYNCFLSRLLTAILTHHHSWISSISNDFVTKLLSNSSSSMNKPISIYMEYLSHLFGYSATISPTLCKVILTGNAPRSIQCKLATLIRYYFKLQLIMPKFEENHIEFDDKRNDKTEDFLIISLREDFNAQFGRVSPYVAPSPNDMQINYYTYNENDINIFSSTNKSSDYINVPMNIENASSFAEVQKVRNKMSTVVFCNSDLNSLLTEYIYEIDELFRLETLLTNNSSFNKIDDQIDFLFENDYKRSTCTPAVTFIVVNTTHFTVEVHHSDEIANVNSTQHLKQTIQLSSKLINTLIESICTLAEPVNTVDNSNNHYIDTISMEINLLLFEKGLEELLNKASILSKHVTYSKEALQSREKSFDVHQFLSEVINVLMVDRTDLEMLLRITTLLIPEECTSIINQSLSYILS